MVELLDEEFAKEAHLLLLSRSLRTDNFEAANAVSRSFWFIEKFQRRARHSLTPLIGGCGMSHQEIHCVFLRQIGSQVCWSSSREPEKKSPK
jgi:hypothetical protein